MRLLLIVIVLIVMLYFQPSLDRSVLLAPLALLVLLPRVALAAILVAAAARLFLDEQAAIAAARALPGSGGRLPDLARFVGERSS